MKGYFWKVYKTNNSLFETIKQEQDLKECPFDKSVIDGYEHYEYVYIYCESNSSQHYDTHSWGISNFTTPDKLITEGYSFVKEVGLQWIRGQKLKKLN